MRHRRFVTMPMVANRDEHPIAAALKSPPRPAWMDDPARHCAGVDSAVFFPEPAHRSSYNQAKALCADCPLKSTCFEWAMENDEAGFWGGTSHNERRKLAGKASWND